MPSSYTARARLTLQAPGENNNTWGTILNNGVFQLVEDAILGAVALTISGPVLLTANNGTTDQSRMAILQCSGTGGTITAPGVQNRFLIDARAATGAIVVTTGGGATATVEAGNVAEVYCPNGSDFVLVRDTNIATQVAGGLAAAKLYADNKMVSGASLPGSSLPGAFVWTNPTSGAAEWHVPVAADITGLPASLAANSNLALAFAVSL